MAETGTEARPPMLKPDNALFLDFDGTIVAFAQQPDGVIIEAALPALLVDLGARLGGALAIVTGRRIESLDALLGAPQLAAAGLHGLEWRLAGGKTVSTGDPVGARRIVEALQARFGGEP